MTDAATPDASPDAASGDKLTPIKRRLWPRLPIMLAFVIMVAVAETLLTLIAIAQALWLAFGGAPNRQIASFSNALGRWLAEVARYQGCATDSKPFPWGDWPGDKA